jgi:hypothetical protein
VYNGYEPDEIPQHVTRVPRRAILLGTLSDFNDFQMLFRVLSNLDGEFVHIGVARRFDLISKAAQAGLSRVHATGYLPRADALRESAKGSVMLMSLANEEHLTLPTKVFDYVGLGGPVLCLGDQGATAEFIEKIPGLGLSVPARDGDAIRKALETCWTDPNLVEQSLREEFTRAAQIRRLARVLDSAALGHV